MYEYECTEDLCIKNLPLCIHTAIDGRMRQPFRMFTSILT